MRVVDRTVLVTGGASGIGIAITRELARRGNRVVVAGRNEGALRAAAAIANVVDAVRCDITSDDDVDALRTRLTERFGALDILVNNAGTLENYDFVTAEDAMRRATNEVTTNVLGTLRMTKAMLPLVKRSDAGAIVMNTSIVGVVPSSPIAVYGATKAALHSFSPVASLRTFEGSRSRVRAHAARRGYGGRASSQHQENCARRRRRRARARDGSRSLRDCGRSGRRARFRKPHLAFAGRENHA